MPGDLRFCRGKQRASGEIPGFSSGQRSEIDRPALRTNDREEAGKPAGAIGRWRIYDAEDGSLISELSVARSQQPPFMLGGLLLTVREDNHSRHLVALDPRSGKALWERAILAPPRIASEGARSR